MANKTETKYEVRWETWLWNDDEENYVDGPFSEKDLTVKTLKEAKELIKEFKEQHPGSFKGRISYDESLPEYGIIHQECICDLNWNFVDEKTNEKSQMEFTVFKVIRSKEE